MAFYGSSRDAYTRNLEEAFRVRNASFSRYVSTLSRMQPMVELPLRPYRDEFFDLSYDPYGEEFDNEVDDRTLGSYVNTMVFNSALGVVDDRQCCGNGDENFEKAYPTWVRRENSGLDSGGAEHPKGRFGKDGTFYNRTPRRNPNKGLKKKKKKTTEEHGSDDPLPFGTASGMKDGHPLFTASVYQLREYIHSIVEGKVRQIHQTYEQQFQFVNKERMNALAQLIKAKEMCSNLLKRIEKEETTIRHYKDMCDRLESQVEVGKEAKRRRRLAKKQRKTDLSASSFDETGDESCQDYHPTATDVGESIEEAGIANDLVNK